MSNRKRKAAKTAEPNGLSGLNELSGMEELSGENELSATTYEAEPVEVIEQSASKKSAKKRMSSITRKLQWQIIRKKMKLYFWENLIVFVFMSCGWAYMQEEHSKAGFQLERQREIIFDVDTNVYQYVVWGDDDKEIVKANIFPDGAYILECILALFIMQNITIIFGLYGEHRKIRKTLKPINEIALKADQLNRFTLSDGSKYLEIESAIESIKPGEEAPLSLQDKDLEGIEAAMNNLLIRMKETYQQQARFVNDASHELRTPIAVIQGYANMLERWGREDEEVLDESIHAIVHEADHMNKLVEQLLFLARGDSGKTILKKEELSLNDMMQEIYEESLMIDENHIYRYKAPEEEIKIIADQTLLKQAVRILLDNAAKYTEKKDEIKLGIGRDEKGRAYLQVQDTGIGMAEADVKHMFERFYRSDETREIKGTGLGLSIAKWIVDKHNGHFEILSRTELGTRIRIVLEDDM